jgi:methylmalonyl-CoA mutase cobalamin-binding subunit
MTTLFRYKESIRRRPVRQPQGRPLKIVLSSLPSDSDAWNMIALQVIIEGMGHQVVNLGAGVPVERVLEACRRETPDCLVLSTVNGKGSADGATVIGRVRADPELAGLTAVIGGRFGGRYPGADPRAEMLGLGFDEAFHVGIGDTGDAVASLREFVAARAR